MAARRLAERAALALPFGSHEGRSNTPDFRDVQLLEDSTVPTTSPQTGKTRKGQQADGAWLGDSRQQHLGDSSRLGTGTFVAVEESRRAAQALREALNGARGHASHGVFGAAHVCGDF